ncbi:cleavage stimulating factor 64 [Argentina anserina]|uniref:cleavage stimulating factor 64 n=1 Tax=Argentina anserina TaxID=57926 RepID=UPI002176487E|nr:cleavage stimulating factor 64 [Potentilla anserina]
MASSSQHRCVFVGNIPYDATEEQLIEICQEVGPVVSFRLVIDRETGKPKGYGFCEYKDEETALSARRNLQGYEINGRQLRVDFAENDKGTDRNREQGRGGPGVTASVDPQKQVGGPAVHGDSLHNQPIGLHIAITAAAVMAGALGDPQAVLQSNQNSLQNQSALANDPLTLHLAKMSRSQLTQIISEVKGMAIQNKELAHKLFLARPQLPKALFQAQIMLGMVTPQMLQNVRQASGQSSQPLFSYGQQIPLPAIPNIADLAPPENRLQSGLMPKMQDGSFSAGPQNLLVHSQFSLPRQQNMQPRMQLPQHANHNVMQHATLLGQAGISALPPIHPQSSSSLSIRPQAQVAKPSISSQKMQPSLLQHPGQVGPSHLGHNAQMVHQNATLQHSPFSRPLSDAIYQPGTSLSVGVLESINKDADRPSRVVAGSSESVSRPSKLMKLDDGRSTPLLAGGIIVSSANESALPNAFGAGLLPGKSVHRSEGVHSEKQISEPQIPPEVDSALLQQVLSLPPEKLNLLPPEQREEVIKLQQRFRQMQQS